MCDKYCYVIPDPTPMLVLSVSTLLLGVIYTCLECSIMQLLNSVAEFFTGVFGFLNALLWTTFFVNISVFHCSVLVITVLTYNMLLSIVKESTVQRKTEVQKTCNYGSIQNCKGTVTQSNRWIMTQTRHFYMNPTSVITTPLMTPAQASKRMSYE